MNSTLRDYLLVLRRWWRVVLALPLLAVTVTALYFIVSPTGYRSEAVLFVSTPRDDGQSNYAGDDYSKKRVDTFVALSKSPEIAQRVIDDVGLDSGVQQMAARVNLAAVRGTVLLKLTTTGDTPLEAQAIGNAYVEELRRSVNALETVSGGLVPRVDLVPVQPPSFEGQAGLFPPWLMLGAAAAVGLIAGALGAVILALLDGRIRRAEDAAEATGMPVLATFRSSVPWEKSQFLPWDGESGRQLRSTLDRLTILGSKVIVVASPERGAGKTGVALTAARVLADRGSTVALVDFDSRGSRLASALELDNVETVSALVRRDAFHYYPRSAAPIMNRPNWHGVVVIPFGSPDGDDPGVIADHPGAASMLDGLRAAYDWVIVDTPAANEFSDAVRLAHHADAVVLIAKAGSTAFERLREVCNQLRLAGGHVQGVVFVDDSADRRLPGSPTRNNDESNDIGRVPQGESALPSEPVGRR